MFLTEHVFSAMGSRCAVTFYADDRSVADAFSVACEKEVVRLERKYSRFLDDSIVSEINRNAGVKPIGLDDETYLILQYADTAFQHSDGRFDITSGPLSRLWDFRKAEIPDDATRDKARLLVGWQNVGLSQQRFMLPHSGMEIDLGGIVKEYAADALCSIARDMSITSGLVDLAGDMAIIGPHPDGKAWNVGIKDPRSPESAVAEIPLASGALASSGNYARCFEIDGQRYSHLIDPITGWPVKGLTAVSIWAPQCIVAGSLSTMAMLMNESDAVGWLQSLEVPFVCMRSDGEIVQA